jgi:hypothetical protein
MLVSEEKSMMLAIARQALTLSVLGSALCSLLCALCSRGGAGAPSALCEVTTTLEQLKTANQSLGPPAIAPDDVGIFTALINLIENSAEHCSDYPPWSFHNTRKEYDAWMASNPAKELWMYQSCAQTVSLTAARMRDDAYKHTNAMAHSIVLYGRCMCRHERGL